MPLDQIWPVADPGSRDGSFQFYPVVHSGSRLAAAIVARRKIVLEVCQAPTITLSEVSVAIAWATEGCMSVMAARTVVTSSTRWKTDPYRLTFPSQFGSSIMS